MTNSERTFIAYYKSSQLRDQGALDFLHSGYVVEFINWTVIEGGKPIET